MEGIREREGKIDTFEVAKDVVRKVFVDAYKKGWRPEGISPINIGAELATVLETFPPDVLDRLTEIKNSNNQSELAKIRDAMIKDIKSGALQPD